MSRKSLGMKKGLWLSKDVSNRWMRVLRMLQLRVALVLLLIILFQAFINQSSLVTNMRGRG